MARHPPLSHKVTTGETVCPYCGVGCRLWGEVAYNQVLRVKGVADAPANLGGICAKGVTVGETVATPDRLVQPMLRPARGRDLRPVSWDALTAELAQRLRGILADHGPDALAFYGSGQLDTQTVYCVSKLFKGCLGTNNTDSNSRLCMATAVAAYRTSLGADGPPTCYDDIDHADVILIIGSNMAEAHPVTFDRIRAARKANPALKLVVADPRRTLTAELADLHLAVTPGRDMTLLNAVGRLLLEAGTTDPAFIADHTNGFAEYRALLERIDLNEAAAACGIPQAQLLQLASWLGRGRRMLSFYCMGLGQSIVGMWKINSLINLHLLTGTIGRTGCGPFSLTGQPNAMGGREAGLLAHQLPGYRFVEDPRHRREVEAYWRLPGGSISPRPGLTAVEMFRALERGRLKAIWIAGTNPLVSLPDLHQVRRALQKAELVIVQDCFHPTETTQAADFLLPAAGWAEREWTSTNSERMVSWSEKLVEPPGRALPDWQIVCRVARGLGFEGFDFPSAAAVWDDWIGLTAGRPCDMTGMPSGRLTAQRHLQWPCPEPDHPGTKRLYGDRCFPTGDGRANFLPRLDREPKETVDHEFPLVLTTGRLYSHWHSLTRTGKVPKLVKREPGPFVQIHPTLADRLGLTAGELCQVSSRRGTVQLKVQISDRVPAGLVFVPMHWGDLFAADNAANYLTLSATGRIAKQPELKYCAVAVERIAAAAERSPFVPVEALTPDPPRAALAPLHQ